MRGHRRTSPSAVIAATLALGLAGAGAARADDCDPEGAAGSTRAPVVANGADGFVLTSAFADAGALDDAEVDLWYLTRSGRVAGIRDPGSAQRRPFSPTLVTRPDGDPEIVEWRGGPAGGAIVAAHRGLERVLVADVAFPGYRGVAAAEAPDGTLTLLYAAGATGVAQRIAPDGTAGPAHPVAPAPRVTHLDHPYPFSPLLAVDGEGTAFGVVRGDTGGIALRWPAAGAPQLIASPALVRTASEPVLGRLVPDGRGGAWLKAVGARGLSLLRVSGDGVAVTPIAAGARSSAGPVVDASGRAVLAWGDARHAYLQTLSAAGARSPRTALASRDVEAVALDPRTGTPWALTHVGTALALQSSGRTVMVRGRRHFRQSSGSLAIGAGGRAWVVWEEASERLDRECREFPVAQHVRWATFGLRARHVTSQVLRDAGLVS